MKLDSKYFDNSHQNRPEQEGTAGPNPVRMARLRETVTPQGPKGRGAEGQFHNYCTQHVQEYNKTYNYFDGMKDDAVAGFQKDAQTGHRPTWKLGQNAYANINGMRRKARNVNDPYAMFTQTAENVNPKLGRALRKNEIKALNTLGLDENATAEKAKSQYKILVKRLHPDANGGSRENEDTLKAVIHAYDTLRASGFC